MNDFLLPRQTPKRQTQTTAPTPMPTLPEPVSRPVDQILKPQIKEEVSGLRTKRVSRRKKFFIAFILFLAIILAAAIGSYVWYEQNLSALDPKDTTQQRFVIKEGETPHQIADSLQSQHIVHSATAFYLYLIQVGKRDHLQAGTYSISPSESVPTIVTAFVNGNVEQLSVTFYPGAVINKGPDGSAKFSVTTALQKAGYSSSEITAALDTNYDEPTLFTAKPKASSLEGYVYGDTYRIYASDTANTVIKKSLDEFSGVVTTNDLIKNYQAQGLTLYQGITLASIVQREVSGQADQKVVAQIFLSRIKQGMPLGSDVTYLYGAALLGVTPSPSLDSPYNTRVVTGLPPGPISAPGLSALLAVAHPASTSYLYFLSGDDGKTYFASTDTEQQANVAAHCQQKCSQAY